MGDLVLVGLESGLRLYQVSLSHPVCFPFLFSLQHPLFSSLFSRENCVEIVKFLALSRVLRLVWAQNQPNFRPNRQNAGNFTENPCIPGNYPATAWVFCRFPQFCLRFCPRPALRLRETREFPEWSTKHPLFSLEISGNAKCWGPSVFLFVFRKTLYRYTGQTEGNQNRLLSIHIHKGLQQEIVAFPEISREQECVWCSILATLELP